MNEDRDAKVILVDTNRFFVKRLSDELHKHGFEVIHCSEPAYALTAVEWNMPVAILCATNLANSDLYTIPLIVQADERTKHIAVIAIGEGGEASLLDAFRASYDDFIERRVGAQEVARHLVEFLLGRRNSLPLPQGTELPAAIQTIAHSGESGALRLKTQRLEGVLFFRSGELIHAESGTLVGDAAISFMIEHTFGIEDRKYKFLRGCAIPTMRTVQDTVEELIQQ
jgi:DNA-binding NtrC family response regulator